MSVLRKALCAVVIVGVVSGCAVSTDQSITDQSGASDSGLANSELANTGPEQGLSNDALVSSDATNSTAAGDAQQHASAEVAARPVLESKDLLKVGEVGYDVQMERGNGFTRLLVNTGKEDPLFDVFSIENPPRLVLDILGQTGTGNKNVTLAEDPYVKGIRVGGHQDRSRIVFDLTPTAASAEKVNHSINSDGGRLVVTFQEQGIEPSSVGSNSLAALPDEQVHVKLPLPEASPSGRDADLIEADPAAMELAANEKPEARLNEDTPLSEDARAAGVVLDSIVFNKDKNSSGQVILALTKEAAYKLEQTNPSEYVLTIPGATAAQRTKLPQIAAPGTPGIRTVRAVQEGETAKVRMFIDPGVAVLARADGEKIVLSASNELVAKRSNARAQLAPETPADGGDKPSDAGAPAKEGEDAKPAPDGGILAADSSKVYSGRLISLDLQDTDIDNALRIIAEVSNLNIIASDDVTGKVTLRLIDVPWDQALDVILKTNGLDQVREGNVVRIAPVDKLRQEQLALKELRDAQDQLENLLVNYIRVSYARVTDIREQVETVLSERGTVTVDERTNQIIIKDIKKGQDAVSELVRRLDLRTPQVLLETQIVEAQRNILRDLGFQWGFAYVNSPETGNATGLNFPNTVSFGGSTPGAIANPDGSVSAAAVSFPAAITSTAGSAISGLFKSADGSRLLATRLTALETEGKVKIISRPQVATVNNKEAEIKSVETIRVRLPDSGLSVATGSGASASGAGSSAFEEIDIGIQLTVTPQASPDYYVLLDVQAKSSTLGSTVVDNIPSTIEREATSTILVKSGQTFALGGVYRIKSRDEVQGVPFMKDIPALGVLFRKNLADKNDEELIFFLTPHIVEGSFDPSLM